VSLERNSREVVASINSNPLMATQNLAFNAKHDEELLREMLASM
jgi:hypothetical protein